MRKENNFSNKSENIMETTIIHELPQRMRVRIELPHLFKLDLSELEETLLANKGVDKVGVNRQRKTLLLFHDGAPTTRENLLKSLKGYNVDTTPIIPRKKEVVTESQSLIQQFKNLCSRPGEKVEQSTSKKPTGTNVLVTGALVAATPWLPRSVGLYLALSAILPRIEKGVRAASKKQLNSDLLDAAALGAVWGLRNVGTAGKLAYLLLVRDYIISKRRA